MENNRKDPRFSFREAVGYQIGDSPLSGSLAANISAGGIRLTVKEFLPLNAIVRLQLNFSEPVGVLPAKGRVAWVVEHAQSENFDVGIEFIVDQDTSPALRDYMNSHRLTIE